MKVTMKRPLVLVLVAALVAALAAGCGLGGGGDKAGGSRAPVVLRLAVASAADESDAPAARFFASRVAELSDQSLRVDVVFNAAGQKVPDTEARVTRMVRAGQFDLGWIGSRAWDGLGLTSFQALQAPFLVTSHALLDRIATGPLAPRMLAELERHGLVGLALVPDGLRHPIGVQHPLASPADFAGARVRVIPSRATDALMRALGATPVHVSGDGVDAAMARREIDGTEHSLGGTWPGGHYLTANVTFFAKALTLFAGRRAYERLDADQRAALRAAAEQTVARVAAHTPPESRLVRRYCDGGRVVTASRDDLAALTRAAQPVYAELERDAQTRAFIAAIRELKATMPVPAIAAPPDCAQEIPTAQGRRVSPATLNGTYRWRLTKAGAIAAEDPNDPDIGRINTMTLRDGRWLLQGGATGTYEIVGNRIVFDWPEIPSTLTFTFKRHANGDLDVKPVLPMDRGDRFVWAAEPWRRVGPPIRAIP
jgi:TRAP-type C4-dicarboxylate transport system substrate-binding protein